MIDQGEKEAFIKEYEALCKKYNLQVCISFSEEFYLAELDPETFEFYLRSLREN